jgi:hypothetical protein
LQRRAGDGQIQSAFDFDHAFGPVSCEKTAGDTSSASAARAANVLAQAVEKPSNYTGSVPWASAGMKAARGNRTERMGGREWRKGLHSMTIFVTRYARYLSFCGNVAILLSARMRTNGETPRNPAGGIYVACCLPIFIRFLFLTSRTSDLPCSPPCCFRKP